jgi:serine/threonine protein kinase
LQIVGSHCPNIVQLKEFIEDLKEKHVIVEYADGGDMETLWNRRADIKGEFSEQEVWNLLRDISNALRYLETGKLTPTSSLNPNRRPILHADIKPANIAPKMGVGWKLIDFDSAVLMESKVHVEPQEYGGTIH